MQAVVLARSGQFTCVPPLSEACRTFADLWGITHYRLHVDMLSPRLPVLGAACRFRSPPLPLLRGRRTFDTLRGDMVGLPRGHTASDMLPEAAALRGGVGRSMLPPTS